MDMNIKEYYEKQGDFLPIGAQHESSNEAFFGKGAIFYFHERFERTTKMFPKDLTNKTLLDLGCGSGVYSCHCAKKRAFVISLDCPFSYLDKTRILANKKGVISQIRLIQGSADLLPFRDSGMDIILALEILEHVPNYRFVLKEINRVLKKDGVLVFSFPSKWSYKEFRDRSKREVFYFVNRKLLKKPDVEKGFLEHLHFFSIGQVIKELRNHGFEIIDVDYGCYFYPIFNSLLGRSELMDNMFQQVEKILSLFPTRHLAWNVIVKARKKR